MLRSLLVLLLASSLWPSSATASPGAPATERREEIRSIASVYGSDLLRSAGGLELLRGLRSHAPLGCSGGSGHAPDGGPHAPGGHEPLTIPLHERFAPRVEDVDGAVAPLCERLPYFATAPPFPR